VIASVLTDRGLSDLINARLVPEAPEVLTPGAAVAGMLLKGWGFAHRPVSWTPPCLANKPLALWGRAGLAAEFSHRLKRGRTRDDASPSGCDVVLQERALAVCAPAGIDQRVHHLDTTSCSRTGAYVPDRDEPAMTLTHGDAKDHRPDLKQAVLDLLVSPDGGVPCLSQSGEGQTADIHVFQERAQALMTAFAHAPSPRSLVAEAKRYHADQAPYRQTLGVITRIPTTRGVVSPVITPALTWDTGHPGADHRREQPRD
jgi:hypothetical protein